jgi:DNA-directed RNA polymerase subunit M/transcription elongation factor TFIIS
VVESVESVEEWRRLKELYARLTDEELQALADNGYELTDVAKQALRGEILTRGLQIQVRDVPAPPESPYEPSDFDPSDLDLVVVHRTWDLTEARQVKGILNDARIPSYLGPENLEDVEVLKSSFENGLDVKVREVDNQFALQVLAKSLPTEEPDDTDHVPVCPRCKSDEIVFQSLDTSQSPSSGFEAKFNWSCDACGYQWKDDGIEEEK